MTCRACGETKRPDEMSRSGSGNRCKECRNAVNRKRLSDPATRERCYQSNRAWRAANADNRRSRKLAVYGITLDEYADMLARQGDVCAICMEPCPTGKSLAVDHNHATGEVRGLLCARCNVMIGMARDSQELLHRGVRYLNAEPRAHEMPPHLSLIPASES